MAFDEKEMFATHSPDDDIICKDCKHKIDKTIYSSIVITITK